MILRYFDKILNRTSFFYIICLITISGCKANADRSQSKVHSSYDIEASINPETGFIEANIRMHLVPDEPVDTLRFLLHRDLLPVTLRGYEAKDFTVKPFQNFTYIKEIIIPVTYSPKDDSSVSLEWSYSGSVNNKHLQLSHSAITPKWTELPLESGWIPTRFPFNDFIYDAEISLPDDYQLVSAGRFAQKGDRWTIQSDRPAPDATLIISNQMQTETTKLSNGKRLSVHYTDTPKETVDFILSKESRIMNNYLDILPGDMIEDEIHVTVSPLKDIVVQNYSRNNLIAIGKDYGRGEDLFSLLAHESAHFWWGLAKDTRSADNFLSESFAQYFSWSQIGEEYGDQELQEILKRADKNAKQVPPLDSLTIGDIRSFSYVKGPALLFELKERMGAKKFQKFYMKLLNNQVGSFQEMLDVLKSTASESVYGWFYRELNS